MTNRHSIDVPDSRRTAMDTPCVRWTEVVDGTLTARIGWNDGSEDLADLTGLLNSHDGFAPLRAPSVFAELRPEADGHAVEWPSAGLDWGADTLYWLARVQRPVTGPEIAAWQDRLGLSLQTAADMLGMSRSSFAALKSRLDAIPRHRAVLIRALERDAILRAALYRPRQPGRPRRPT